MNKQWLLAGLLYMFLFTLNFSVAAKEPIYEETALVEAEIITEYTSKEIPTVYSQQSSESDMEFAKELFVRYMKDEIEAYRGKHRWDLLPFSLDSLRNVDFFIYDVDGDGILDIGHDFHGEGAFMYKYSPEEDVLKEISGLGIFAANLGTDHVFDTVLQENLNHYIYTIYNLSRDKLLNITFDEYYIPSESDMEEPIFSYYINRVEVTKEQWIEIFAPIWEMLKYAPKPLTYEELTANENEPYQMKSTQLLELVKKESESNRVAVDFDEEFYIGLLKRLVNEEIVVYDDDGILTYSLLNWQIKEDNTYLIFDVDGDGEMEVGIKFPHNGSERVFKYDPKKDILKEFVSCGGVYNLNFLGNCLTFRTIEVKHKTEYILSVINSLRERLSVIRFQKYHPLVEDGPAIKGNTYAYYIDYEEVTKEKWEALVDPILEMRGKAAKTFTYEELTK